MLKDIQSQVGSDDILYVAVCTGGPDNEKTVHKILLAHFHQEF